MRGPGGYGQRGSGPYGQGKLLLKATQVRLKVSFKKVCILGTDFEFQLSQMQVYII